MPAPSNGAANGSAAAATSPNKSPSEDGASPSISWPVNRPASRGKWTPEVDHEIRLREQKDVRTATAPQLQQYQQKQKAPMFPVAAQELLPGQPRSLSGIGFRAFALGQALGLSLAAAAYLAFVSHSAAWRAPFFVTTLSLFHFLEFWTTARFNTPSAKTRSFLFSNGKEYQIAHSTAMFEYLVTHFVFPGWHDKVNFVGLTAALGIALIAVGQTVRSVAMAQAGTNFNHLVQSSKKSDHELVTDGIYAVLRHPSYFGFFWWGLGTQLMLGNVVCFFIYAAVLWRFFSHRIMREYAHTNFKMETAADRKSTDEEKFLVNFFGEEYRKYRARTTVAIPFIA